MFVWKKFAYLSVIKLNKVKNAFWQRLSQCYNILVFILSNLLFDPLVLQELKCIKLEHWTVAEAVFTTDEVASIFTCGELIGKIDFDLAEIA